MSRSGADGVSDQGFVALTAQGVAQHVVTRVRSVAAALPGELAVDDGAVRLDYAELERRAASLSSRIAAAAPAGEPVAVLLGHGAPAAVAVLAVLGTGSPVVVLDPTTPVARLHHYVEQSGATTVVTDASRADDAAVLCPRVVRTDRALVALGDDGGAAGGSWPLAQDRLDSRAPLVIVYTSGSTGRPKGVVAHSESVLHDATTNGKDCYGPGAVIANLLPMAFSAGIGLLLAGMATGSAQVLFDPRTRAVSELPAWLLRTGATVLAASPAILRGAVAALAPGEQLGRLTAVTTAGETIHAAEMERLRTALGPGCTVHNRYGSSETWLIAEHVIAPGAPGPTGAVPVGLPVDGVSLRVVDEGGQRRTTGTGRLEVTSRWLTDGYWRAPEATAAVFTRHPDGATSYLTSDTATIGADGVVRLLGRVDHSVKIRGHLVEPGEVDAVLHALPDVREAVVVGVLPGEDDVDGRARLVAYVVPEGPALQVPQLRRAVRSALPAFMVPEQVVLLEALPRTERGKLDRSALPTPPAVVVGSVPPRTDWERVVAAFVARALDLDGVGAHDDFFELGGDSLAAEALLASMAASLDVPSDVLTTGLIAENPTVAELAEALRRRRRAGRDAAVVTFNGSGSRRPLFVVAGAGGVALAFRRLAERLGHDQPLVALQARGLEGGGRPEWSVRSRARHHLAQLRQVQPHGPYRLAGHSLGALVALDLAHQLREAGEQVESLVVIDSFPPDPEVAPPALEGTLPQRAKTLASILLTGVVQSRGLGHYDRFHLQGKLLQRRYRTQPWDGRALVLVAADDPDAEARSRWADHLHGPWALHRTGGDHTGVLQEPHVGPLAELVRTELDDLDGRATGAGHRSAGAA
ncbi:AMP-binding protein [Streptomyces sp. NP160]|nr:AMP-binding protein [Streptomyces sp. NP160]